MRIITSTELRNAEIKHLEKKLSKLNLSTTNKRKILKNNKLKNKYEHEIAQLHQANKDEWVLFWERLGTCPVDDHAGTEKARCIKFEKCHECLTDIVNEPTCVL